MKDKERWQEWTKMTYDLEIQLIFVITININVLNYPVKKTDFLWPYLVSVSPANLKYKAKEKPRIFR